jgi:hypothetical protein
MIYRLEHLPVWYRRWFGRSEVRSSAKNVPVRARAYIEPKIVMQAAASS